MQTMAMREASAMPIQAGEEKIGITCFGQLTNCCADVQTSSTWPGISTRNFSSGNAAASRASFSARNRRVDRLVGELERPVMMRERKVRAAVLQRLHRLLRIHVLVAHEPARLVGADRQDGEPERAVFFARGTEMMAVAETGIADMDRFFRPAC